MRLKINLRNSAIDETTHLFYTALTTIVRVIPFILFKFTPPKYIFDANIDDSRHAMTIFISNLQFFYIHCQDFDDLVERMAPAAMAAVNPGQSKTESNQEPACW